MSEPTTAALGVLGLSLPALRGEQGGRVFYLTLPTNGVLTGFFPADIESDDKRSQRPMDPNHARQIRDYITTNTDGYALGALVYAVDSAGHFDEVVPGSGIGVLRLPLDAQLRSIDGQHRREGLRLSVAAAPVLQQQSTAVVIYVEPELDRRRQMFSDMNNTARKVSKALNVSFDARDSFARAASELSDHHPLLAGRIDRANARVLPGSGNLYTLASIYDALKRLFVGPTGRVKDSSRFDQSEILARGNVFFDALAIGRAELQEKDANTLDELRAQSILLSSTTLRVLASAVWTANQERHSELNADELAANIAAIDFRPNASVWQDAGFVSPGRSTPNARSQEMKAASDQLAHILGNNR
jgi:DNA sulfur modification protein DndB